jgi:hypothetical protein
VKGVVDRLEGDRVVLELEDGNLDFDIELFPENIKEGDIVEYLDNKFVVNEMETKERKAYIDNMFQSLINKEK